MIYSTNQQIYGDLKHQLTHKCLSKTMWNMLAFLAIMTNITNQTSWSHRAVLPDVSTTSKSLFVLSSTLSTSLDSLLVLKLSLSTFIASSLSLQELLLRKESGSISTHGWHCDEIE